MKIKGTSYFKNFSEAVTFLENWSSDIQRLNNCRYERITVDTSLGKTNLWAHNPDDKQKEALFFFPGARTCGLFWDMDNALLPFKKDYRIFIADVNGQPTLSEGNNPFIKSDGYGIWASELFRELGISNATVIGASLGGLICMKLCLHSPHLVNKVILMNPAGINSFSGSAKNLYYNFLPILFPSHKNLKKFFDNVVFYKPDHTVPVGYYDLMKRYMLYVLRNFKFKGDYPAPMIKEELKKLTTPVYLILGDKDILFPLKGTIEIAEKCISSLEEVGIVPGTAHGIETSKKAIDKLLQILQRVKKESRGRVLTGDN